MWVSKRASRSLTERPRACHCLRSASSVEPGPESTIAWWPSDSSSAAAMERGRPIQRLSSVRMAVIRAAVYRNTVDSSLRQVGFRVAPELRTEYEFLRILEKQKRKE